VQNVAFIIAKIVSFQARIFQIHIASYVKQFSFINESNKHIIKMITRIKWYRSSNQKATDHSSIHYLNWIFVHIWHDLFGRLFMVLNIHNFTTTESFNLFLRRNILFSEIKTLVMLTYESLQWCKILKIKML